jgi:hypothetical protein
MTQNSKKNFHCDYIFFLIPNLHNDTSRFTSNRFLVSTELVRITKIQRFSISYNSLLKPAACCSADMVRELLIGFCTAVDAVAGTLTVVDVRACD